MEGFFNRSKETAKKILKTGAIAGVLMMPNKDAQASSGVPEAVKEGLKTENVGKSYEETTNTIDIASFCKTGTIEFINPEMRKKAKEQIRDFLKNVDFDKFSINIVGKYSVERPWEGNEELKEKRRQLGEELVMEVLTELNLDDATMQKIEINSSAIGQSIYDLGYSKEDMQKMSPKEKEALIDKTQGIDISLEKKKALKVSLELEMSQFETEKDFEDVVAVLLDNSRSMEKDNALAVELINNINKNNEEEGKEAVQVITIKGENKEEHLETTLETLRSLPKYETEKEVLVITDEPDANFSKKDYQKMIVEIVKICKEKNIVVILKAYNPDNKEGGSKVATLSKDTPYIFYLPEPDQNKSFMENQQQSRIKEWYKNLPAEKRNSLEMFVSQERPAE